MLYAEEMKRILFFTVVLLGMTFSAEAASKKVHTLYTSLDMKSVAQHLAFYHLYPHTEEGQQALSHAFALMGGRGVESGNITPLSPAVVDAVVALVNKQPEECCVVLGDTELAVVERLGSSLGNRRLKGRSLETEEEVLALAPEEIDIARGLFISQLGNSVDAIQKIRSYEAMIDLMALQILARIPANASDETKIEAINTFIFHELGFRFPPHSLYAKDIDLYTFLPSVLDCRRGVCLGVSILYLCLAQRLDLPLEIITPPGHIYVRYHDGDKMINIETTARGIDLENEVYLGVDVKALQERDNKEVIGMAHFNQAAVFWQRGDFAQAKVAYEKALPYLKDDMLLKELLGYAYILEGSTEKGEALMKEVNGHIPDFLVSNTTIAEEYLKGDIDKSGIEAVFLPVDETRESILKKKDRLEEVLKKFPNFKAGIFSLATAWLQLHRLGEALQALEQYHRLRADDPTAEYYLCMIHAERLDYNKAWEHLQIAESIVKKAGHAPKALKTVRRELSMRCPL